jgi:hypothetical protein
MLQYRLTIRTLAVTGIRSPWSFADSPKTSEGAKTPQHARRMHAELVSREPAATQKFLEAAFELKFDVLGRRMGDYRIHLGLHPPRVRLVVRVGKDALQRTGGDD